MKKRDIILDFTSLLDVTLIIIFFFVLFSHMESQENKKATEQVIDEYNEAIQQANAEKEYAEELSELYEEALEKLRESDERQAYDNEALLNYAQSCNLKLILEMQDNGWIVRANCNNETCGQINSNEDLSDKVLDIFKEQGYTEETTILCDFIYDGSQVGSARAYRNIVKELDAIKMNHKYVYISETNLSVGRE